MLVVPSSNSLTKDDNGYVVIDTGDVLISPWSDGYTALSDATRVADAYPYLKLAGRDFVATFGMATPGDTSVYAAGIKVTSTAKVLGTLAAFCALVIRDSLTGNRRISKWYRVAADNAYHTITADWAANPFYGGLWTPVQVSGERYRFGIVRLAQYGDVRVSRLKVESL